MEMYTLDIFNWVQYRNISKIHEFIKNGIDINIQNEDGQTPLMLASESGDFEYVQGFLELGADPNVIPHDGYYPTLLKAIIFKPNTNIVTALLKAGSNVDLVVPTYCPYRNISIRKIVSTYKNVSFIVDNMNLYNIVEKFIKLFNKCNICILIKHFLNKDLVRHIWEFL